MKKPTEVVVEMWIGELFFAVLCELIGFFLVKNRITYTIGIASGMLLACFAIYHMWWVIDKSFDKDEKDAGKFAGAQYGIRYALLILLVSVLYVTNWGNAFAAFLSYIGMKVAAYIQPFIHKLIRR